MSALLHSLAFAIALVALGLAIVAIRGSADGRSPGGPAPVASAPGGVVGQYAVAADHGSPCGAASGLRGTDGLLVYGGPVVHDAACATLSGPTPVIAEAPVAVLLPITAGAAIAGAMLLLRRRERRHEWRGRAPTERSLPTDE